MKTFITFGQSHTHSINGKTLDKDTIAVIHCRDQKHGRELAFEFFGDKFCFEYPEAQWDEENMKYFPKGYVEVN